MGASCNGEDCAIKERCDRFVNRDKNSPYMLCAKGNEKGCRLFMPIKKRKKRPYKTK